MKDKDTHLLEEAYTKIIEVKEEDDLTPEEKELYDLVYDAKEALFKLIGIYHKNKFVTKDEIGLLDTARRLCDRIENDLLDDVSDYVSDDEFVRMSDVEADADTLASAGWGTDEDYGSFGDDY